MSADRSSFSRSDPSYFFMEPMEPLRSPPPDRETGLWGALDLEVECLTEIHVGGSAPDIVELDRALTLIQGMTTIPSSDGPLPVVPGSSVKGAVRAIVEAITPSCERVGGDGCSRSAVCPACTVFGAPGWRATVAFSDLVPPDDVELVGLRIAQRYSHRHAPRQGRRLYRLIPEDPLPDVKEAMSCLPPGTLLRGRFHLEGATREAVGLVTLALGVPPRGLPLLRVGAGKNRGLAQARTSLQGGRVAAGFSELALGKTTPIDGEVIAAYQEAALRAWPEAERRLERIRSAYSSPS